MSNPSFDIKETNYDQSTLKGRIRHFFQIFNPLLLFTSDTKIKKCQKLLQDHKEGAFKTIDPKLNADLCKAKVVTESILHPQTNEKVPLPFRFSAFVPMNIPIVVGMITAHTTRMQLFWQWFNQSYNVAINHCNGNKTNPLPPNKVAVAYCSAVAVSCGIYVALTKAIKPSARVSKGLGLLAKATAPFLSVSTAGVCNVCMMRGNEHYTGIQVKDADGKFLGVSTKAADKALSQVSMSRAFMPLPVILLPGLIKSAIDRKKLFCKMPRLYLPVNVAITAAIIFVSLPLSIGLYPQEGSIAAKDAEDRFKGLKRENGEDVEYLYFNKGL